MGDFLKKISHLEFQFYHFLSIFGQKSDFFHSDYTGFVPSNPIWVEEPTFYNYQHFYYTTPSSPTSSSTSSTTTSKPKQFRKKLKVKLKKKKPTKKVIENDFYYIDDDDETEKSEEGLVSKIVNFLALLTGISSDPETVDSTISAKQAQCLKII